MPKPKWIEVTKNYDHRWPSGAVTALIAGTIVYVKDEVAEGAIAGKAAKETTKPAADDPKYESSGGKLETDRIAATATREVVTGGFAGYPDAAARARIAHENELAAVDAGVRSEPVAATAADNEALAVTQKLEAEAKNK